jgi:hypothetical protein
MNWRVIIGLVLVATALATTRCANDPALAPFLGSGEAEIELLLVEGTLPELRDDSNAESPADIAGEVATQAPCAPPPVGFPEDVRVGVTIHPPAGAVLIRSFDIPARSGRRGLVMEGLAPGDGYLAEIEVRMRGGEQVFEGESVPFVVLPGGRSVVAVNLSPPSGRRAVLAFGAAEVQGDDVTVPVMISHSLPLRAFEFEFCFDSEVLEPLDAQAVGPRVGGFRGAGGQPGVEGVYRAVFWSPDAGARLTPGRDQVLALSFRFRPAVPSAASDLVFLSAFVTDSADSLALTTYFYDGRVER